MFPSGLILQNLMFSLPQETSLKLSIGLNLSRYMLNSEVYFATIKERSPWCTLEMSQIMMTSLQWESIATDARNLPSGLNAKHLVVTRVAKVRIPRHLAVA